MSAAYGDGQQGVLAQMRAEPTSRDSSNTRDRQRYEGPVGCTGNWLLQVTYYNTHGASGVIKFRHWTIGDAREALADYLKCLRSARNRQGYRSWFIQKDAPRKFYHARIGSKVGVYQVVAIVHAMPVASPVKPSTLLGAVVNASVAS